jgi:hypothetical protein
MFELQHESVVYTRPRSPSTLGKSCTLTERGLLGARENSGRNGVDKSGLCISGGQKGFRGNARSPTLVSPSANSSASRVNFRKMRHGAVCGPKSRNLEITVGCSRNLNVLFRRESHVTFFPSDNVVWGNGGFGPTLKHFGVLHPTSKTPALPGAIRL